jgi:hypothetical protein
LGLYCLKSWWRPPFLPIYLVSFFALPTTTTTTDCTREDVVWLQFPFLLHRFISFGGNNVFLYAFKWKMMPLLKDETLYTHKQSRRRGVKKKGS